MGAIVSTYGDWTNITWPWPQVRFVQNYVLGFAVHGGAGGNVYLFELVCADNTWTATYLDDLGTYATLENVEVIDFGAFYVVMAYRKGEDVVVKAVYRIPGVAAGASAIGDLATTSAPVALTGCNFRGQAVVGGIYTAPTNWPGEDPNLGSVMWSGIGRFEFLPTVDRTAGFIAQMPWVTHTGGSVLRVLAMEKFVMVYGDVGCCKLVHHSSPATTYGTEETKMPGITATGNVGGNELIHCALDREGYLWIVTEQGAERVGYKEYMKELMDAADDLPVMISYVPSRRCFYIANNAKGYVLNEWGLYETNQLVTSAGDYRGILAGFFKDTEDYEWRIATGTLDFNARGSKTIERIGVGGSYYNADSDLMQARVQWRKDYHLDKDSFNDDAGWKKVSAKGVAHPKVTANEFRVKVRGTTYVDSTLSLDYLKMLVKYNEAHSVYGEGQKL